MLATIVGLISVLFGGSVGYGAAPRMEIDTVKIETKLEAADERFTRFEANVGEKITGMKIEVGKLNGKLEAMTNKRYTSDDARNDFGILDDRIDNALERITRLERSHPELFE